MAKRFESVLPGGRTKPLVIECEVIPAGLLTATPPPPERRIFVTKCLGLPEVDEGAICRELLGNVLARSVGLNTPPPALIHVSAHFCTVANRSLQRDGLSIQPGIAAGSEYLRGGFSSIGADYALNDVQLDQAAMIYGFDLAVQNPDRRQEKPNCGILGDQLIAFDFEASFTFLLPIIGGSPDPWSASKLGIANNHVFRRELTKKSGKVSWASLNASLAQLTDQKVKEMSDWIPVGWTAKRDEIAAHFQNLMIHLTEFEEELRGTLA